VDGRTLGDGVVRLFVLILAAGVANCNSSTAEFISLSSTLSFCSFTLSLMVKD